MSAELELIDDETRRRVQHENVKRHVGHEVEAEILNDVSRVAPAEREKAHEIGHDLRRKAIGEFADTEAQIGRGRVFARVGQVVDYFFYVVYGLIGLQVVLELIGAADRVGFKQLMDTITAPLLAPFRGLVLDPSIGRYHFMSSYVVALIVYILVHVAVRALLRLSASPQTSV